MSGLFCHFRLQQEEMVLKMLPLTSLPTHQLRMRWWGKTRMPRMIRQRRRRRRMRRKMRQAGKMQWKPTMGPRVMDAGLFLPLLLYHESIPKLSWGEGLSFQNSMDLKLCFNLFLLYFGKLVFYEEGLILCFKILLHPCLV